MSYVNGTTHYNLPQTIGSDKRDWSDTNKAFADIDTAIYNASNGVSTLTPQMNNIQNDLSDTKEDVAQNTADIASVSGRMTSAEQNINNLTNTVTDVRNDSEDMITSNNEKTARASKTYQIGNYFIYNNTLYVATKVINSGSTIVPNTNCNTVTVTSELANKSEKIVQLNLNTTMKWSEFLSTNAGLINSLISESNTEHLGSAHIVAYSQANVEVIFRLCEKYYSGDYVFSCLTYDGNNRVASTIWAFGSTPFDATYFIDPNGTVQYVNGTDSLVDIARAYLVYI